jgi:hypothetical protein
VQGVDVELSIILSSMYALAIVINTLASDGSSSSLSDYVEEHGGLIALIALIITIIFFIIERLVEWWSRKREENERKRRSCNAILKEIEDHRDTLRNPKLQSEYVVRGQDIKYSQRVLAADAFESVLHSGLFTNFQSETQNSLTNLYLRIRLRNDTLLYLNRFHDTFFLYDNSQKRQDLWTQSIRPHEFMLTNLEKEINIFLDGVSTLIRNNELPS